MTTEQMLGILAAAVIGGLIGGGAISALAYRGLKDKLIQDLVKVFAKKSDLDRWGDRVNAFETVMIQTRDRSDHNADNIIRLQEIHENRWKPLEKTLDRISERLDRQENLSARTLALLESLEQRMDRESRS